MIQRLLSTAVAVLALVSVHHAAQAQQVRAGFACPSGSANTSKSGLLWIQNQQVQKSWRRWTVTLTGQTIPISRDIAIGLELSNATASGWVPVSASSSTGVGARGRLTLMAYNSSGSAIYSSNAGATANGSSIVARVNLPSGTTRSNVATYKLFMDTPGSTVPGCTMVFLYD